MSTIVTRYGKGSPLTWLEVDNNFTNLNTDKIQSGDTVASLTINSATISGGSINGTTIGGSTPSSGAFTTLSASSTVSGTGFSTYLASPPAIGSTTPSSGSFTSLTDSGNLTFTGTGNRITGDFSNATLANRVAFQTSTTNGSTTIMALPNGTGPNTQLLLRGSSVPQDDSFGQVVLAGGSDFRIGSGASGTGTYLPMTFYTGGSERMRIDTSGNVGIGTSSPTFVNANYNGLQVNAPAGTSVKLTNTNSGQLSSDGFELQLTSGLDGYLNLRETGSLIFQTAATERMRIDASGNVGIGTSSPVTKLQIGGGLTGSNATYVGDIQLNGNPSSLAQVGGLEFKTSSFGSGYGWKISSIDSSGVQLVFGTRQNSSSWTEAMRIDSSGNVGIGTSSPSQKLHVAGGASNTYIQVTGANDNAYFGMDGGGVWCGTTSTTLPFRILTGNTERMRIGSAGQLGIGGANYGTAGQVLVSQGASAAPIWGSAGGMVLLGTLTTTSGTTQTLSGLTLTNYKLIVIAINRTSHNSGTSQGIRLLDANGSTQLALAASTGLGAFTSAIVTIDLATGVFSGTYDSTNTTPPYSQTVAGALCGKSTFSTSATSLQFSYSGGSFDAGSITVYGVQ